MLIIGSVFVYSVCLPTINASKIAFFNKQNTRRFDLIYRGFDLTI